MASYLSAASSLAYPFPSRFPLSLRQEGNRKDTQETARWPDAFCAQAEEFGRHRRAVNPRTAVEWPKTTWNPADRVRSRLAGL
ncbi:hypothetical protein [Streptomyces chartreusis]|uniref:hypothetical protein n=1 Tax=Streptomyces chartreusis TaxID=1969 RepID=UPI002E188651